MARLQQSGGRVSFGEARKSSADRSRQLSEVFLRQMRRRKPARARRERIGYQARDPSEFVWANKPIRTQVLRYDIKLGGGLVCSREKGIQFRC